jgi:hypothetical protein
MMFPDHPPENTGKRPTVPVQLVSVPSDKEMNAIVDGRKSPISISQGFSRKAMPLSITDI